MEARHLNPLELHALIRQQPFRPFRMRLSLNITADVRHPEMAILGYSTVTVGSEATNDEMIVILAHIVTIEYLTALRA